MRKDDWGSLTVPQSEHLGQVIEFRWDGDDPILTVSRGAELEDHLLRGQLDLALGDRRYCRGTQTQVGWQPCPARNTVTLHRQCSGCASNYSKLMTCILDTQCQPGDCDEVYCSQPHIVYLAITGRLAKVGMTSRARYEKRMMEQGADASTILLHTEDRGGARYWEKKISATTGLPQALKPTQVLATFTTGTILTELEVERMIDQVADVVGPLEMTRWPWSKQKQITLRSTPQLVSLGGYYKGLIVGVMGHFLIFDHFGPQALDLNQIVGYRIYQMEGPPSTS